VNSVPSLVRGRREFDVELTANPEEPSIFTVDFHRRLSGEPTQIMRRKFVEYLGTDCFYLCRIPVELSVVSASNTKRCSKPSSNAQCTDNFILAGVLVVYMEADSHVGL
jgi:hypothetical protein